MSTVYYFTFNMTILLGKGRSDMSPQMKPAVHMNGWMWRALIMLFTVLPALAFELGSALPVQASGDFGPDTCLQGWVWRDAVTNDHVCVMGATRSQAAYDNSQAANRRAPNGGPFGPDTCLQGWVWREATPSDHVCVTGATRSQTAYDNGQAAARRDSLNVWSSTYTIPPVCNGDTCTSTSTDDIPRYRLHGDHINVGQAIVQLRRSRDNVLLHGWTINTSAAAVGGQFSLDTGTFVCGGSGPTDSYFRVYDTISTRWSAPYYVKTICYVL
jgi:hypothetical protein